MKGLVAVLLAFCVVSQVSAALLPPRKLNLTSENFKHILTWEDPNNESSIRYRVQCSRMHTSFEIVEDCANITARRCDLTKHFTHVTENYGVRVLSFMDGNSSKASSLVSLTPKQQTILGPPIVDVVACDRCISISIQPPVSHLWDEDKQQYVSMLTTYSLLEYKIQLMHKTEKVLLSESSTTENHTFITRLSNLLPNANYCVSVNMTASTNTKPSVLSEPKCVVTESQVTGLGTAVIVSVVFGVVFLLVFVLFLSGLDRAGYICRAKTLIPKVLKSIPTSDRTFIDGSEFISPTFSVPVDLISKKLELEQKLQSEKKSCEGGYTSRKRLEESDTSGTKTSGELPSTISSSTGSSGQANSSGEEDFSAGRQGGSVSSAVCDLGSSSVVRLPVSVTDDSAHLPFNTSGDFNINMNTLSIRDPADVWTGFQQVAAAPERAEGSMETQQAGIALDRQNDICLGVDDLEEEYCSDYEEEEDVSENDDSDSHLISGYMRR